MQFADLVNPNCSTHERICSMSIYITPEVIKDLVKAMPNGYHRRLMTLNREFFKEISSTGIGKTLAEKLFNYCFPGKHVCLHCGSPDVKFAEFTTGYRKYCSPKCTSNSINTKSAQKSFWANSDRISDRNKKSVQTSQQKYGANYFSQTSEGKRKNSEANKIAQRAKFPMTINGRSRKQYVHAARYLTNKVYLEHKEKLDPSGSRGKEWFLDHVFSLFDGFINNVPLTVICHWTNLQLVPKRYNSSKHSRSDKSLEKLYEDAALTP